MQNDQIYSEITDLVSTRADFNLINSQLDLLEAAIYETKGWTFDVVLKKRVSESLSFLILKLVKSEKEEDVIKKIRNNLNQIKFVEVTLAFAPAQDFVDKILNWADRIYQGAAIDIKIDPSILGGVRIIFDGKYYDGSLRTKLDKVLKNYV